MFFFYLYEDIGLEIQKYLVFKQTHNHTANLFDHAHYSTYFGRWKNLIYLVGELGSPCMFAE